MPPLPSRPRIPHIPTVCSSCNVPLEFPAPSPQPANGSLLQVQCFSCNSTFSHAFYPSQIPPQSITYPNNASGSSSTPTPPPRKGRKIGTDERPLETGYYDILGVPVTATTDDIKKAYRTSIRNPYGFIDVLKFIFYRSLSDKTPSRQES